MGRFAIFKVVRSRKDYVKHYTLLIIGILTLPLSGCMAAMHGTNQGSSHQMQGHARTIEKEIPETDTRLSLDVPPISTGDEATLILTASRIQDGTPITGAKVVFHVERMQPPVSEHAEHHIISGAEREAEEIDGKGMYKSRYRFEEHGLYRITGRVWIDKDESATPLTISVTQEAALSEGRHTDDSTVAMTIIGGIGMALMMLIMIH